MRSVIAAVALVILPSTLLAVDGPAVISSVIINEISYNPPGSAGSDDDLEFVELHNIGETSQSVGGWILMDESDGNHFELPAGAEILPGGFLVIAGNNQALVERYALDAPVVGDLPFQFSNSGDSVRLFDAAGDLVDQVDYQDGLPWPDEADGGGATLERVSPELVGVDDFTNFAASSPGGLSGTPGRVNSRVGPRPARHEVVISEISYNPVREAGADPVRHCDSQEFIELHNRGSETVNLDGWSFVDGIRYTFPIGTQLPAGGFLVVHGDEVEFTARYPEVPSPLVHGPYDGRFSDGGEAVLLADNSGRPVDYVEYNDRFPWPINPDGITGTLELADPFSDNEAGWNWEESADFRGSPGSTNSATTSFEVAGTNRGPAISALEARPVILSGADDEERQNVLSTDEVHVTARISDPDGVAAAWLEYQVMAPGNYVRKSDDAFLSDWDSVPMVIDRLRGRYEAVLPSQPHRTLVRYRVRAVDRRSPAGESVTPRTLDPEPNLAYFVYDGVPDYIASVSSEFGEPGVVHTNLAKLPILHVIGHADDIEAVQFQPTGHDYPWTVTVAFYRVDPVDGSVESEVYDHVDTRARGGTHRYHWPKRSWKLRFNKGHLFRGRFEDGTRYRQARRRLNLNAAQHTQINPRGESGIYESLAWKCFRDSDVIGSQSALVQMRAVRSADEHDQYEGDFFGTFVEIEEPSGSFLENNGRPDGEDSSLYEIEGPAIKKFPDCTASTDDVDAFADGLSMSPTPEWLANNVYIDNYLSFRAVVNFVEHVDMGLHNYYYYRNGETGLWELFPWDLDNTFGSSTSGGSVEPLEDLVLPLYVQEFESRYRFLLQTVLDYDRLDSIIDDWAELIHELADADMDRWNNGPDCVPSVVLEGQCNRYKPFDFRMAHLKSHILGRKISTLNTVSDESIPDTPSNNWPWTRAVHSLPVTLESSAYVDPEGDAHVQSHWLFIEADGDWAEPHWETVSTLDLETLTLTGAGDQRDVFEPGDYEFRVRYMDATDRWSFLSTPTRFTIGGEDSTVPTPPASVEVVEIDGRGVRLRWQPAVDPETVLGYRVFRDDVPLDESPTDALEFTDRTALSAHSYRVVAYNASGGASAPSPSVQVVVPDASFGGWRRPADGFDYLYDADPGEDQYQKGRLRPGCLDGSWMRTLSDNWDGSAPGAGRFPGGVEALVVPSAAEDGGIASVLSIEDPGDPESSILEEVVGDNRVILLARPLPGNPFHDGNGLTLVTRFRVHPGPRDLVEPSGQRPRLNQGQVGIAAYDARTQLKRHFSVSLDGGALTFPNATVPVDTEQFQSVWVTIAPVDGERLYRTRVYVNGAIEPAVDAEVKLFGAGTEGLGLATSQTVTYLEVGLSNKDAAGAIQVDFIGYKQGVHAPIAAAGEDIFLRGDANVDGKVNVGDPIATILHLFGGGAPTFCHDAADGDDSGELDIADVLHTLNYLFAQGSAPAAPFPACGPDVAVDDLAACGSSACR